MYENDRNAGEQTASHPSRGDGHSSGTSVFMRVIDEIREQAREFREVWRDEARAISLEWCANRFEAAHREIRTQILTYEEGAKVLGKNVRTLERWREEGRLQPVEGITGVRFTLQSLLDAAGLGHTDVGVIARESSNRTPSVGRSSGIKITRSEKALAAA